ncbi:MAG: hypothetical protein V1934_02020 [Methanobacteriota archaeon]
MAKRKKSKAEVRQGSTKSLARRYYIWMLTVAVAIVVVTALYYQIQDDGGGGGSNRNRLADPSFENSPSGWTYLSWSEFWIPFSISDGVSYSGAHSAQLTIRATPYSRNTTVCGVSQDIAIGVMPEKIGGYYQVRNWTRGAAKQYIQCVVMAFNATGMEYPVQLRYIMAGANEAPFELGNAKFIFITQSEPVENTWVRFERNLWQDYTEYWAFVPSDFTSMRVAFEVRYEDVPYDVASADVYWDDVYLGG